MRAHRCAEPGRFRPSRDARAGLPAVQILGSQLLCEQNAFDPRRVDAAGDEVGVAEDPAVQRNGGLDAFDHQLVEGAPHGRDGLERGWARARSACPAASRSTGGRRNRPGCANPSGLRARRAAATCVISPGRRAKIVVGIFGIDPALDRVAAEDDVFLAKRQRLAGGDLDLLLDQIDAGDHLGDGMFDLDACVDLDEVEIVVRVDQELACAGVDVADGFAPAGRRPRRAWCAP